MKKFVFALIVIFILTPLGQTALAASIKGWGSMACDSNGKVIAIAAGGYHSLALVNTKPVADAGPDQTVYAWMDGIAEVNLDGSGSYDEDNQPLTYRWTWTIDGNTYDTNGVSPTIELPVGQLTTGQYFFGQDTIRIVNLHHRPRPHRIGK